MKNLSFLIIALFLFSSCAKENLEPLTPSIEEITLSANEEITADQQPTTNSLQLDLPAVGDELYTQTFDNTIIDNHFNKWTVKSVKCEKNKFVIHATKYKKAITITGQKDIMKKVDVKHCDTGVETTFYTYVFTAKLTSTTGYYYDGSYDTNPDFSCGTSAMYDPVNCPQSCWTTPKLVGSEVAKNFLMFINWGISQNT